MGETSGKGNDCCREKYWGEITVDEKIERLREIVKRLENNSHQPQPTPVSWEHWRELGQAIDRLSGHTHGEDGKVVVVDKTYF